MWHLDKCGCSRSNGTSVITEIRRTTDIQAFLQSWCYQLLIVSIYGLDKQLKNSDASIYHTLWRSEDCLNLNEMYQFAYYQKLGHGPTGSQWWAGDDDATYQNGLGYRSRTRTVTRTVTLVFGVNVIPCLKTATNDSSHMKLLLGPTDYSDPSLKLQLHFTYQI